MATYRFQLYSDDDAKMERLPCVRGDEKCDVHSRGGWCAYRLPTADFEASTDDEAYANVPVPDGFRIFGFWNQTKVDKLSDL